MYVQYTLLHSKEIMYVGILAMFPFSKSKYSWRATCTGMVGHSWAYIPVLYMYIHTVLHVCAHNTYTYIHTYIHTYIQTDR